MCRVSPVSCGGLSSRGDHSPFHDHDIISQHVFDFNCFCLWNGAVWIIFALYRNMSKRWCKYDTDYLAEQTHMSIKSTHDFLSRLWNGAVRNMDEQNRIILYRNMMQIWHALFSGVGTYECIHCFIACIQWIKPNLTITCPGHVLKWKEQNDLERTTQFRAIKSFCIQMFTENLMRIAKMRIKTTEVQYVNALQ